MQVDAGFLPSFAECTDASFYFFGWVDHKEGTGAERRCSNRKSRLANLIQPVIHFCIVPAFATSVVMVNDGATPVSKPLNLIKRNLFAEYWATLSDVTVISYPIVWIGKD
jgi:hypothetical protein